VHKTPRRTVLIILVLIILTGSFFHSGEKPELIKAIDKPEEFTHKAKCTLWMCLQCKFYLYAHTLESKNFLYPKRSLTFNISSS